MSHGTYVSQISHNNAYNIVHAIQSPILNIHNLYDLEDIEWVNFLVDRLLVNFLVDWQLIDFLV